MSNRKGCLGASFQDRACSFNGKREHMMQLHPIMDLRKMRRGEKTYQMLDIGEIGLESSGEILFRYGHVWKGYGYVSNSGKK